MKHFQILASLLLLATGSAEIRPATTKEGLLAKREELARSRGAKLLRPVEKEIPVQGAEKRQILDSSSYLVGARGYTLIPNGSALSVGKTITLTTTQPQNLTYMNWSEFVRTHRNGLRTIPVPQDFLKPGADTKIVLDRLASFQNLGLTCVTTYQQKPVRIAQAPTPTES